MIQQNKDYIETLKVTLSLLGYSVKHRRVGDLYDESFDINDNNGYYVGTFDAIEKYSGKSCAAIYKPEYIEKESYDIQALCGWLIANMGAN